MKGRNTPAELVARAINELPWSAGKGMWKRRCARCSYWFATPARQQSAVCPDCLSQGVGKGHSREDWTA